MAEKLAARQSLHSVAEETARGSEEDFFKALASMKIVDPVIAEVRAIKREIVAEHGGIFVLFSPRTSSESLAIHDWSDGPVKNVAVADTRSPGRRRKTPPDGIVRALGAVAPCRNPDLARTPGLP